MTARTQEHREVEIRVDRFAWTDTGDDATEVHVKIDLVKVNMDFWTE